MMDNTAMEINRKPIYQVSAPAKGRMFSWHVERRKRGAVTCHSHLCCNLTYQRDKSVK